MRRCQSGSRENQSVSLPFIFQGKMVASGWWQGFQTVWKMLEMEQQLGVTLCARTHTSIFALRIYWHQVKRQVEQ